MGGFFSISDSSPVKQLEKVGKSIRNGVGKIIKRDASKELDNSLQPRVRKNNSLGKFKNTSNLEISKPTRNSNNSVKLSNNIKNKEGNLGNLGNLGNIENELNYTNNIKKNRKNKEGNIENIEPEINYTNNRKNNFNYLRQNLGSIEPKINRNSNNLTLKRINNKINESPRFS